MDGQKTITIEDVGSVLLEKSRRAKRLVLTVKPFRGPRVAVPRSVSYRAAERFARSMKSWIMERLQESREMERKLRQAGESAEPLDRKKAGAVIISRLEELAGRYGFTYNRVTIRCQKTRWGSCSVRNNLSLNARLTRLPPHLMDYVLIHELMHTRHKNHGPRFWSAMNRILGEARQLRRELNRYSPEFL